MGEKFVNVTFPIGMDASISVKRKQTDMFARLEDIIVTNVDLLSIHKKVIKKQVSGKGDCKMAGWEDTELTLSYGNNSSTATNGIISSEKVLKIR